MVLHQLLLVVGSWEGTVTKFLATTQSILAVAAARQLCSQGSESNSVRCLVAVPFFLPPPEVTGVTDGTHSQAPSGGKPSHPLASEMTDAVYPSHLYIVQGAPHCT